MFCVVVYLSSNIVAMPSLYSAYFIITNLFDIPIELSNSIKNGSCLKNYTLSAI
jgi:hypothetical protein